MILTHLHTCWQQTWDCIWSEVYPTAETRTKQCYYSAFALEADPTPWNYPSAGTRTWAGLWVLYILTQVPVIWSRQCCILSIGHFKGWLSSAYLLAIIEFFKCPIGYIWVDWLLNHQLFKTLFKCRDLNNWRFKGHFYEHFLTRVKVMAYMAMTDMDNNYLWLCHVYISLWA